MAPSAAELAWGIEVFNADIRTLQRLAPHLQRVLIVDPLPGAYRLLADLMKEMGAHDIAMATTEERALALVRAIEPQIIFTEYAAPGLDGLELTRELRRGGFAARQAPVIMVSAEATQTSILGARNSGVHEFLRKPYTAGDLFRRVENVMMKPRPWIQSVAYIGPDRRRFNSGEFTGAKKRRSDAFKPAFASKAA